MKEKSFGMIPLMQKDPNWFVFLVQLRSGNHWGFPKGHSEKGETPIETARRELKEETSLHIDQLLSLPNLLEQYTYKKNGKQVEKIVQYFVAIVSGKPKLPSPEILNGGYFTIKEALQKITYKESRNVLQKLEGHLCNF